jgi:phosphoglycerate kinase
MRTIEDFNFKGKRALIRVDFNVPLDERYQVTDTTRIDAALPTIRKILGDGGSVILMSHLGRPKEGPADKFSLRHVVPYLSKVLGRNILFAADCIGEEARRSAGGLQPGEVLLLENLRFYKQEEKGDRDFAATLASFGDVYVNDAFGTAHRAHASTSVIAGFFLENKMFGYLMAEELKNINKVLVDIHRPFTAILGGAKVSGKIEVINNLLGKVDKLIIGGGMTFTFIKAMGGHIGRSLVEEDLLSVALKVMDEAKAKGVSVALPEDVVAADAFDNDARQQVCDAMMIPEEWLGLDIGPATCKTFSEIINRSSTILWNGPMGVFEMPAFGKGTRAVAEAIVAATAKGAFSLVGGGDSVAAINKYRLGGQFSYVSTGGGAMLEYIEGKELPGVKAITG